MQQLLPLALAASVDLAVCFGSFLIWPPFVGDKWEYFDFLEFLPWAFIAIWIAGRISAALVTRAWPRRAWSYALVCIATVALITGWIVLGMTGWEARGIGEFPGWKGIGSVADVLGMHFEPGWNPSWTRRIASWPLLGLNVFLAALFWLACSLTRRALTRPG